MKGTQMDKITLSPSGLGDLARCPRCFFDDKVLKQPHPRGIFPTLPGGMDRVMKTFFDAHRGTLPTVLRDKVPGVLYQDLNILKRWRMWQQAPQYFDPELNVLVRGGIDDMLIDGDILTPFDVKTKGSEPKDDGSQYYQTQMDCYNLIFQNAGFRVSEKAFLCYIYPMLCYQEQGLIDRTDIMVSFDVKIYKLDCSIQRAKELIVKACQVLRGPRPDASATCEYCVWASMVNALNNKQCNHVYKAIGNVFMTAEAECMHCGFRPNEVV